MGVVLGFHWLKSPANETCRAAGAEKANGMNFCLWLLSGINVVFIFVFFGLVINGGIAPARKWPSRTHQHFNADSKRIICVNMRCVLTRVQVVANARLQRGP